MKKIINTIAPMILSFDPYTNSYSINNPEVIIVVVIVIGLFAGVLGLGFNTSL